jgi:hypothetical protein
MYKKRFALIFVLLLTACGNKDKSVELITNGYDAADISISGTDMNDTPKIPVSENNSPDQTIPILWNFTDQPIYTSLNDRKIEQALNERFKINIRTGVIISSDQDKTKETERLIKSETLPDIFSASLIDPQKVINEGAVRPIPWDMVQFSAPRYWAMLSESRYLKGLFTDGLPQNVILPDFNREYIKYILPSLSTNKEILDHYSVYRLDWLEEFDFIPNGEVVKISDNLYFTNKAFTCFEFETIMGSFASTVNSETGAARRLVISETAGDWPNLYPLMGMFGLNGINISEEGKATLLFANEAFREFLRFMRRMIETGSVLLNEQNSTDYFMWRNTSGWFSDNIIDLFGDKGLINYIIPNMVNDGINVKFLITPPEIGPEGIQGIPGEYWPDSIVSTAPDYFINANVDDKKLERILEVFDAVSFDPELYAITRFGFESEDFAWVGKPYDSTVKVFPRGKRSVDLFATGIMDENAGKMIYGMPSEALYRFAASPEATAMILYPYKNDPYGERAVDYEDLIKKFPLKSETLSEGLIQAAENFYRGIVTGEKDIDNDWDAYIGELRILGLDEWNAFFETLPYTW